jgi:hypothetical protein
MTLPPKPVAQPLRHRVEKLVVLSVKTVVGVENNVGYIGVAGQTSNTAEIFTFLAQ